VFQGRLAEEVSQGNVRGVEVGISQRFRQSDMSAMVEYNNKMTLWLR